MDTQFASVQMQELARSVPALIQKHRMKELPDGKLELTGPPMSSSGMCADETFVDEKNIANWSASLIAKDKILTAAHCLNDSGYSCMTYRVVFDYMNGNRILDKSQIYNCINVKFTKFDPTMKGIDLAIIGYPMGISQKVMEEGKQIGVLVRGTGSNFAEYSPETCSRWRKAQAADYAEGNDLSTIARLNSLLR
jgi:hypothetical protein